MIAVIGGFGGCNRYFGSYTLEGDALKVSGLGSTKRACPPPEMELESRFLERLGAARYLRLEGSTLTLTGDRGDLVFELREAELPAGEPLDSEPACASSSSRAERELETECPSGSGSTWACSPSR